MRQAASKPAPDLPLGRRASYQGTALAVPPKGLPLQGFSPCGLSRRQVRRAVRELLGRIGETCCPGRHGVRVWPSTGAKAQILRGATARLKPCPDTKTPIPDTKPPISASKRRIFSSKCRNSRGGFPTRRRLPAQCHILFAVGRTPLIRGRPRRLGRVSGKLDSSGRSGSRGTRADRA
jgi:hypothetical protein